MISVIKDDEERVISYIEWEIVNGDGEFQDNGRYCYIQDYWVHPKWLRKGFILNNLIKQIYEHKFSKNLEWVHWNREKYDYRPSKLYSVSKFKGRIKCLKRFSDVGLMNPNV